MKQEHRKALEPYSQHIIAMTHMVQASTPDEIQLLHEACAALTTTNCAWYEYEAARVLKGELEFQLRQQAKVVKLK